MIVQLLLLAQLQTISPGFEAAKSLADAQEAALPKEMTNRLLESQARAAGQAFAACMPLPPPKVLPDFTVVMSLEADGTVKQTWLKGDSDFAECVEHKYANSKFFQPPHTPFYSSFEFTFHP